MTERSVRVTQSFTGREGRTVIIDEIPAAEATLGSETRLLFEAAVVDRLQTLVRRALVTSDATELRIAFSPADAGAALSAER